MDRVPEELWMEVHNIVQEVVQWKRNARNELSEEALQIAEKRREAKGKGEKESYEHLNAEFQRLARGYKKAFLNNQCKEI